eukprot:GHVS01006788.1.p1 GENE.GHVS01006788.1~~GHVS01006788.1.p1  ORF type:complete len:214 (+),score=13.67 GHVS01006788.1:53-643(+)
MASLLAHPIRSVLPLALSFHVLLGELCRLSCCWGVNKMNTHQPRAVSLAVAVGLQTSLLALFHLPAFFSFSSHSSAEQFLSMALDFVCLTLFSFIATHITFLALSDCLSSVRWHSLASFLRPLPVLCLSIIFHYLLCLPSVATAFYRLSMVVFIPFYVIALIGLSSLIFRVFSISSPTRSLQPYPNLSLSELPQHD